MAEKLISEIERKHLIRDLQAAYKANRDQRGQMQRMTEELIELRRDRIQFGKMARQIDFLKKCLLSIRNGDVPDAELQGYIDVSLGECFDAVK